MWEIKIKYSPNIDQYPKRPKSYLSNRKTRILPMTEILFRNISSNKILLFIHHLLVSRYKPQAGRIFS